MSRLLEFFLGSILITVFTVAFLFFSTLHYILKAGGMADCAWRASARTWSDSNGDGRVTHGEPPLSNVQIHVDDVENQMLDVNLPAITDHNGDVQWNVSIPGCSTTVFEIHVDIPEGYRITTRPRLEVTPEVWGNSGTGRIYYFGFVSDR